MSYIRSSALTPPALSAQSQLTSRECSHVCLSRCESPAFSLGVCQSVIVSPLADDVVLSAATDGGIRVCSVCQSGLCVAIFSLIACRRTFSFPASTTIRLPLFVLQCHLLLITS
jgi:hypothetical protein